VTLVGIVPANAVGATPSGAYPTWSYPYRYFDQDAAGADATFSSGQLLQCLPGIRIKGTGTSTWLHFLGNTTNNTRMFKNGDVSRGILIKDGEIRLKNGGVMTLPDN
jgi:hypothetical protein